MPTKERKKHLYDSKTDRLYCGKAKYVGVRVATFEGVPADQICTKCDKRRLEIEEYKKSQQ